MLNLPHHSSIQQLKYSKFYTLETLITVLHSREQELCLMGRD